MRIEPETISATAIRLGGVNLDAAKALAERHLLDRAFDGRAHFHHDVDDDGVLRSSLVVDRFIEEVPE